MPPLDGGAKPHPKPAPRANRRYRRKVASPKQWQAIIAAKTGPCRACVNVAYNGSDWSKIDFHHVVPRSSPWFGDDTEDNMVPLHRWCHDLVESRTPFATRRMVESLTDAEYAYAVERGGEQVFERVYGIEYRR